MFSDPDPEIRPSTRNKAGAKSGPNKQFNSVLVPRGLSHLLHPRAAEFSSLKCLHKAHILSPTPLQVSEARNCAAQRWRTAPQHWQVGRTCRQVSLAEGVSACRTAPAASVALKAFGSHRAGSPSLWSFWRRLFQRSGLPTPASGGRGFSAPSPDGDPAKAPREQPMAWGRPPDGMDPRTARRNSSSTRRYPRGRRRAAATPSL